MRWSVEWIIKWCWNDVLMLHESVLIDKWAIYNKYQFAEISFSTHVFICSFFNAVYSFNLLKIVERASLWFCMVLHPQNDSNSFFRQINTLVLDPQVSKFHFKNGWGVGIYIVGVLRTHFQKVPLPLLNIFIIAAFQQYFNNLLQK